MKLLFDHDVPDDLSYLLRQLGHDVSLLWQFLLKDAPDAAVFQFAYDNDFLLVTCNRDDFIGLAKQKPFHGINESRISGLGVPTSDFHHSMSELGRPISELGRSISNIDRPMSELERPTFKMERSISELGRSISEAGRWPSKLGLSISRHRPLDAGA